MHVCFQCNGCARWFIGWAPGLYVGCGICRPCSVRRPLLIEGWTNKTSEGRKYSLYLMDKIEVKHYTACKRGPIAPRVVQARWRANCSVCSVSNIESVKFREESRANCSVMQRQILRESSGIWEKSRANCSVNAASNLERIERNLREITGQLLRELASNIEGSHGPIAPWRGGRLTKGQRLRGRSIKGQRLRERWQEEPRANCSKVGGRWTKGQRLRGRSIKGQRLREKGKMSPNCRNLQNYVGKILALRRSQSREDWFWVQILTA